MGKARPINEAEFRRAYAFAATSRYPARNQAILSLSARAGMRIGEIRDLDLINIYKPPARELRDRIYLASGRTKWGHAREFFLNRAVRKALESHLERLGTEPRPSSCPRTDAGSGGPP